MFGALSDDPAHRFAPVQSVCRWRGDIGERIEGRVSRHTCRDRVAEIVTLATKEHPYEVPGVPAHGLAGAD